VLKKGFDVPNFDQVVQPRRDEHLPFGVKTEVCDAMLEVVKACLGLRLSLCVDLDVTLLADSDGDLVAFKGQGQTPRGAPVTNSASTFSAMMLSQTDLLLVVHGFEIPEKRTVAKLTVVTLIPISRLFSFYSHVPEY